MHPFWPGTAQESRSFHEWPSPFGYMTEMTGHFTEILGDLPPRHRGTRGWSGAGVGRGLLRFPKHRRNAAAEPRSQPPGLTAASVSAILGRFGFPGSQVQEKVLLSGKGRQFQSRQWAEPHNPGPAQRQHCLCPLSLRPNKTKHDRPARSLVSQCLTLGNGRTETSYFLSRGKEMTEKKQKSGSPGSRKTEPLIPFDEALFGGKG